MTKLKQYIGLYLFSYLLSILPSAPYLFSNEGMLNRFTLFYRPWIDTAFLFNSPILLNSFFALFLGLSFCLILNKLNYLGIIALCLMHLVLMLGNHLIIHEPQPLAQIILFGLVLAGPRKIGDEFIKKYLILFLGIYYFIAGIAKLGDPQWQQGYALYSILTNPQTSLFLDFNIKLLNLMGPMARIATWAVLAFEITFILGIYSPLRKLYILSGLILHLLIGLTLDVGSLSVLMISWYAVFINERKRL